MTLMGTNDENLLPMMLGVQQHHNFNNPTNNSNVQRGNVIVSTSGVTSSDLKMQNCKKSKMYQTTSYGTVTHQPASVARRNARERNRVKQVNNGFATLRQHIPQSVAQALGGNAVGMHGSARAGSKKLSKVETLRMAVEYIRSLQRQLEEDSSSEIASESSPSPISSCSSSRIDMHSSESHSPHATDVHRQHMRQDSSPLSSVPCSEASSSPTPSFTSESSSTGSQGYGSATTTLYTSHSDGYDNYNSVNPQDEELLDVISWWQQSQ